MLGKYFNTGIAGTRFVSAFSVGAKSASSQVGTVFRGVAKSVLCLALTMGSPSSFALGVGAAEADSYIGQQLSVRIPLFNVSKPHSLEVSLATAQFGGEGQSTVEARLDRSNSQLAIKVSSNVIINEPYLNFTLNLVDDSAEFEKEFTVLFNLPSAPVSAGSVKSARKTTALSETRTVKADASTVGNGREALFSGAIMGPYDTAVAGQIAQRFGAVLDGQSLWRVARRINGAMGASRSQVMWALYQANPDAFASDNIESLKAGSFLIIPSETQVKQHSDFNAKANLQALSRGEIVKKPSENTTLSSNQVPIARNLSAPQAVKQRVVPDQVKPSSQVVVNKPAVRQESSVESPFQVTSINQTGGDASTQVQSQAIIASLTETVGNMSQQLERKDKKIEFLEEQVEELKSFIRNEDLVAFDAGSQIIPITGINRATNSQLLEAQKQGAETESTPQLMAFLPWLALGLLSFFGLIYMARERLAHLAQALNLFDKKADMEFSVAEQELKAVPPKTKQHHAPESVLTTIGDELSFDLEDTPEKSLVLEDGLASDSDAFEEEASISFDGTFDDNDADWYETPSLTIPSVDDTNVILASTPKPKAKEPDRIRIVKHGLPSGALDGNYDESEIDKTIDFLADEISARENDDDLTFEQRFDRLLAEKDYDFARELLDFARYNEINDERYHYERLRMLEHIGDEDGFYEYYYSIEDKITEFRSNIQTQISQLVVQMAHV